VREVPSIAEVLRIYTEFSGIHPVCEVFPMKPDDEFWQLVEHIQVNGVVEKILREKSTGLLVDGRNRLLACSITNTLFEIEDVESDYILAAVTAKNQHSKKFTASVASMIAHELKPFYAARAKERQVASGGDFREKAVVEKIPQPNRGSRRLP
jgi:hypothetical protein